MKVIRNDLNQYSHYFEGYSQNVPVIYSTLQGQYQGEIFSDKAEQIIVLVTKFDFIFLGGNDKVDHAEKILDEIIFEELVKKQGRKEIIVFGQDDTWNETLSRVFSRHHGVCDVRMCYRLNKDKFSQLNNIRKDASINVVIGNECGHDSAFFYPAARVMVNDMCVSFCSAFMVAKGFAEIDVATEEAHRQKGYAKHAAIALINELISQGIEPIWCTWPYRTESQALAKSLGFELKMEVPAHIWVDEFGC